MRDEHILSILLARLDAANREHEAAKKRFLESAVRPLDIQHRAIAERNLAGRMYLEAMIRVNRYLQDGVIPPEIKQEIEGKEREPEP